MPPPPSSPALALDRTLLDDEEGFAAWEAHLLDEAGNGVFVSWGFGQPLTRASAPAGTAANAPGLSVLILAQGSPSLWLHQRFPAGEAAWEAPAGRWRFGKSQVEALRDLNAQVVILRLDCELPGTRARLQGHVEMGGPPRRPEGGQEARPGEEDWSPLMGPGQGRAILSVGGAHRFHLQGRAYHHRHGRPGAAPEGTVLAGFGHVPFADRDVSFQVHLDEDGRGRASGLTVHLDGRSESAPDLEVETAPDLSRLTLRQGGAAWLDVETDREGHDRGVEGHMLTHCRAPLLLPAAGVLRWLDERALTDARARQRARRFVHVVGARSPLGVRLETGPVRDRLRRALHLG